MHTHPMYTRLQQLHYYCLSRIRTYWGSSYFLRYNRSSGDGNYFNNYYYTSGSIYTGREVGSSGRHSPLARSRGGDGFHGQGCGYTRVRPAGSSTAGDSAPTQRAAPSGEAYYLWTRLGFIELNPVFRLGILEGSTQAEQLLRENSSGGGLAGLRSRGCTVRLCAIRGWGRERGEGDKLALPGLLSVRSHRLPASHNETQCGARLDLVPMRSQNQYPASDSTNDCNVIRSWTGLFKQSAQSRSNSQKVEAIRQRMRLWG